MKKSLILKLVLTAVLVFTFTGCGAIRKSIPHRQMPIFRGMERDTG